MTEGGSEDVEMNMDNEPELKVSSVVGGARGRAIKRTPEVFSRRDRAGYRTRVNLTGKQAFATRSPSSIKPPVF